MLYTNSPVKNALFTQDVFLCYKTKTPKDVQLAHVYTPTIKKYCICLKMRTNIKLLHTKIINSCQNNE